MQQIYQAQAELERRIMIATQQYQAELSDAYQQFESIVLATLSGVSELDTSASHHDQPGVYDADHPSQVPKAQAEDDGQIAYLQALSSSTSVSSSDSL